MNHTPHQDDSERPGVPRRDVVWLLTPDPAVARRIDRVLKSSPPERVTVQEITQGIVPPDALILFHAPRLDRREGARLERILGAVSNPVAILCPEGDPRTAFDLARTFSVNRLIGVESDLSTERLAEILPRWVAAAVLRPDWAALGIPERPSPLLARLQRTVDADPARHWSVEEIADSLRVSRSTLARKVRETAGRSPKSLLLELRYQLVERARTERHLETERIANLFEFSNPEEVHRWRYRHRNRRLGARRRERQSDGGDCSARSPE